MLTRGGVWCLCSFLCCFDAKRERGALTELPRRPKREPGVQQLQVSWSAIKLMPELRAPLAAECCVEVMFLTQIWLNPR